MVVSPPSFDVFTAEEESWPSETLSGTVTSCAACEEDPSYSETATGMDVLEAGGASENSSVAALVDPETASSSFTPKVTSPTSNVEALLDRSNIEDVSFSSVFPKMPEASPKLMPSSLGSEGALLAASVAVSLLTGGEDINTDLNNYVTSLAMDGLFTMLSKEENSIRLDPVARVTDLLKKVFGSLDEK